ncbi:MAG: chemotaxis protein CheB [Longimicrobiaceae bacterium]
MQTRVLSPPEGDGNGGAAPERAYRLVAIAASAGGLPVLREILGALPPGFALPVVVVQHRSVESPEVLPALLARATPLRVKTAEEGDALAAGTVYVAPVDRHVVVRPDGTLRLMDGSRIRYVRSSAEPLFQSAAYALDGRVIAVVLTGGGANGSHGVIAVAGTGGVVIVQDPDTAQQSGMPRAALATGVPARVLPAERIAPALLQLASATSPRAAHAALEAAPAAA